MGTFKAVGHVVDIIPHGPGPAIVIDLKEGPLKGQRIIIDNKEFIWELTKALTGDYPEVHGREYSKLEKLRSKTQVEILKNATFMILAKSKRIF